MTRAAEPPARLRPALPVPAGLLLPAALLAGFALGGVAFAAWLLLNIRGRGR